MLRSLTLWVILGVTLSLAAPQSGKVRSVLGDVSFKKKGKGDWASLRVGAKVQEKDVIQTEIESGVLISMPDGSTISIEENALVEFSQILMIKDSQVSEVEVKKGMLRFDAQKQKGPQSKFRFRTGTGNDRTLGGMKSRHDTAGDRHKQHRNDRFAVFSSEHRRLKCRRFLKKSRSRTQFFEHCDKNGKRTQQQQSAENRIT